MTSPHQSPQLAAVKPADVPHAGVYTAEQITEIIRRVHAWIKAGRGRSQIEVARRSGIGRSTLNFFLSGKYEDQGGNVQNQAAALDAFLTREEFGDLFRVELEPVQTPTYAAIFATLDAVKYSGDIAIVTGAPGCGKSFAAKRYADTDPRYNVYIDVTDGMGAPQGFIARIRQRLTGADRLRYGYLESMIEDVRCALAASPKFLIFNDAQKLGFGCFDLACYLSESCGVGIAFVGHELMKTEIRRPSMRDHEAYDRIADRAVFLDVAHDADAEAIEAVARQLLPTIDDAAVAFLCERAAFPSMRSIVITCKLARKALAGSRAKADLKLLRRAFAMKHPVF